MSGGELPSFQSFAYTPPYRFTPSRFPALLRLFFELPPPRFVELRTCIELPKDSEGSGCERGTWLDEAIVVRKTPSDDDAIVRLSMLGRADGVDSGRGRKHGERRAKRPTPSRGRGAKWIARYRYKLPLQPS